MQIIPDILRTSGETPPVSQYLHGHGNTESNAYNNCTTVIDYDTELSMNGLDFKSYKNVIEALNDIGLIEEAEALIAFERDSSQEGADICYSKLALNNDYEAFWNKVYSYADENIKK